MHGARNEASLDVGQGYHELKSKSRNCHYPYGDPPGSSRAKNPVNRTAGHSPMSPAEHPAVLGPLPTPHTVVPVHLLAGGWWSGQKYVDHSPCVARKESRNPLHHLGPPHCGVRKGPSMVSTPTSRSPVWSQSNPSDGPLRLRPSSCRATLGILLVSCRLMSLPVRYSGQHPTEV
jgi:hypothetical protein